MKEDENEGRGREGRKRIIEERGGRKKSHMKIEGEKKGNKQDKE